MEGNNSGLEVAVVPQGASCLRLSREKFRYLTLASSSKMGASSNSLSWTEKSETKSDIFEDYGGMKSGSHSQTLGRLYA
ncbi:unnamed protein product [Urochloa humidicola]